MKRSGLFVISDNRDFGDVSKGRPYRAFDDWAEEGFLWKDASGAMRISSVIPRRRFQIAIAIALACMIILVGRAAFLQIARGNHYRALAEENRVRTSVAPAPRGILYDHSGAILAENIPAFSLTMMMRDLPRDPTERARVFDRIGKAINLTQKDLDTLMAEAGDLFSEEMPIVRDLPYETAMRLSIETTGIPGFRLRAASVRSYPLSHIRSLSHVLGYVGAVDKNDLDSGMYRPTDTLGKSGLEKSSETILRGTPGKTVTEVDARGRELMMVSKEKAVPGSAITLGIDAGLQAFTEKRLVEILDRLGIKKASVVAMDPKTGRVRALVSWPAYENNSFVRGMTKETFAALADHPDHPLFPRAISGEFPSGSTFKPFIAYAALAEEIISEHTSFLSTGGLSIGPWFFPDWKAGGHGITDVRKAIAWSVNTFFYIIGGGFGDVTGLGVDRLTQYARLFGFGSKTGIDLPNEADGFLPSKEWKEKTKGEPWFVGDTYHLSIGQGDLLVTPLQMAVGTAMLANGGTRVQPMLLEKIDGKEVPPVFLSLDKPVQEDLIALVRQGMRQAVTEGSVRALGGLSKPVAGKTGTAQTAGQEKTNAWFIGFGPYTNPTLAMAILIEEGGEGSAVAVPLAKDIFEWWFLHRDK